MGFNWLVYHVKGVDITGSGPIAAPAGAYVVPSISEFEVQEVQPGSSCIHILRDLDVSRGPRMGDVKHGAVVGGTVNPDGFALEGDNWMCLDGVGGSDRHAVSMV